ncbi:MAG: YdcF family protein [Nitrospiraceae bacterium]|nr:YdcF family protein [Nitrospiraceae bacterium]
MESLFFWVSKLAWFIIAPDNLLLFLLLVSWILLRRGAYGLAKRLLGFVVIILMVVLLLPIGEWLLYPLEARFPANPKLPKKIDGIIVLSGAENAFLSSLWGQEELGDSAERDIAFLELARQYPDAKLVFSGGSGSLIHQGYKAADVANRLFDKLGLDLSRVTFERDSRNTFENVVFSKEVVRPDPGQRWILITSASHMPRAVGVFCKAGWPVIPYPVDHRTMPGKLVGIDVSLSGHLRSLEIGEKEWVGLIAYRLSGKTAALFPDQCVPPF